MSISINSSHKTSIQNLLNYSLAKGKVKKSDLLQCLKSIRNNTNEPYNEKNLTNLRQINYILSKQNSGALNKKRRILHNISMIISSDRKKLPQASPVEKKSLLPEAHRKYSIASYDTVYSDTSCMSARHYNDNEKQTKNMNKPLNSELNSALEQRQQCRTSAIDDTLIKGRKTKQTIENKKTQTERQAAFAKILENRAKTVNPDHQSPNNLLPLINESDNQCPVVVNGFDATPEYATVQKHLKKYKNHHSTYELQKDVNNVILLLNKITPSNYNADGKHIINKLNYIASDINGIINMVNYKLPLPSKTVEKIAIMTEDHIATLFSLDALNVKSHAKLEELRKTTGNIILNIQDMVNL